MELSDQEVEKSTPAIVPVTPEVTVVDKTSEPQVPVLEKNSYTIEEALEILATPPREVVAPQTKTPEEDLDILDLRTSPVQVSPPRLAYYRVGEPNHPCVKLPTLSPKKNSSPSSRWRITREPKLNDLRITIRRYSPPKKITPVKRRVFREWRQTMEITHLEDPDKRKRPRPPPKETTRKRRRSPSRTNRRKSSITRSPRKKSVPKRPHKSPQSPRKNVKRDKPHSPRSTLPRARPSTYRTPKRPKLGLVNPPKLIHNAKRILFS
ncbi:serine/arginine repetitive matrix protein 1-like [Leptopilina boulardi]|uniref:serine/arginine repetitive matrix protein 1-like n=1 Tax=Leptopilina boulardi TaxID=63433 RepID=UPI0021F66852|nr:serine/arginine repetitive matrix protein 1-like [Leptopilina boulardi]